MMTSWFTQVDRCKSIPELIAVVRDFLATWTPAELARIPPACRPSRVRDKADLESLHSSLVEEYRKSRASGEDLDALQRLTSFVVRATIRLSELDVDADASREQGEGPAGPERSVAPRER